jgi:hypothetical protein
VKTTIRLALVLAAALLTTTSASAWCHKTRGYAMPMAPMAPVGFAPVTFPTAPALPAVGVGGAGAAMSLNMSASGDVAGLMMLPFIRLLDRILGGSGNSTLPGGITVSQLQELLRSPAIRDLLRDEMRAVFNEETGKTKKASLTPSPEVERARAEVSRLLSELAAVQNVRPSPAVEAPAARPDDVKRLLGELAAVQNRSASAPAPQSKAALQADVKQLLAELAAVQNGPKAGRAPLAANRAK